MIKDELDKIIKEKELEAKDFQKVFDEIILAKENIDKITKDLEAKNNDYEKLENEKKENDKKIIDYEKENKKLQDELLNLKMKYIERFDSDKDKEKEQEKTDLKIDDLFK